jgi:pyridoxamine 5'-phosphate oxidase
MTPALGDDNLPADPLPLCERWLAEARAAELTGGEELPVAETMTLATAASDGRPSARAVLLRGLDARGFAFFTNYESRKGRELDANPWAALVFTWLPLQRQLRAAGRVVRLSEVESDTYFATRPRGSQLAAWASQQSRPLADRAALEARWQALDERYSGAAVPRPPHWGGYRVEPDEIEFWEGHPNRLHDRFAYTRAPDGGWRRERLAP